VSLAVRLGGVALGPFLVVASTTAASAATLSAGVVGPNIKVRPSDTPATTPSAALFAAKNEVEPFQIVLASSGGPTAAVSAHVSKSLLGPGGAVIPDGDVVLYRVGYYQVGTPSNTEGASGPWPDPLVPDVDTYLGEHRNAFPLDVPDGETRVIWVDVLVPLDAAPGAYAGEIAIDVGGSTSATVPVSLQVGKFSLPSTASLSSAFGMGWSEPCVAHTGNVSCDASWNEDAANQLRARYLRAGLEHRFTISDSDFQPPLGASAAPYEKYVMPYVDGSGDTRLPGARLTAIRLDGSSSTLSEWVSYAKNKGFFDRLFYYPVDEPASDSAKWSTLLSEAQALHAVDPAARIVITAAIQEAGAAGASASDSVDLFCPVINYLDDKSGGQYPGDQTATYTGWLSQGANRELWAYQSCMSHGCGSCGDATSDSYFTGWPNRVIDSSAVQDRCFPWIAFELGVTGELYFETTYQLSTAWDPNGQCAFSGHGDGTLFYPGKPSVIGGQTDIPVESIRMKLIREGMEDYEYLKLVAQSDPAKAKSIATTLFPSAFQCAGSASDLDAARKQLFDLLDQPSTGGSGGAAGTGGGNLGGLGTGASSGSGGVGANAGTGGASGNGANRASDDSGGCGCRFAQSPHDGLRAMLLGLALVLARRRRRA
jgi:MYXO-CTERM domain-containing protein